MLFLLDEGIPHMFLLSEPAGSHPFALLVLRRAGAEVLDGLLLRRARRDLKNCELSCWRDIF